MEREALAALRAALQRQLAAAREANWAQVSDEAVHVRAQLARLDGRQPPEVLREITHLQLRLDAMIARRVREGAARLAAASAARAYRRLGADR